MPVLETLTCTLHILCPLLFILDAFIQDGLVCLKLFPYASISPSELFFFVDFFSGAGKKFQPCRKLDESWKLDS
jgi:hypothetical protein